MANAPTVSYSSPSPTFPRKIADVERCSHKINPNKKYAECWPGAVFGPCWLLTERLRYETTRLLPDLRDRVHVHGRRDVAYGSHCRGGSASGDRRAAGASREVKLSVIFECRKASPNATASGPIGRPHLGLMSTKTSPCGRLNKFQQPLILSGITHTHNIHVCSAFCDHDIVELG